MTAPVFVDTNVLLYAVDSADPVKQIAAAAWRAELWRSRRGRISYQVLQEFYAQAIRKDAASAEAARAEVRDLFAWQPAQVDERIIETAWELQQRFSLSFWDALIVAAAHSLECRFLLTEDLSHGQDLDGVRVVNPFLVAPSDLEDDLPKGPSKRA
jgi:predicted nucleic acid-binding protein